MRRRLSAIIGVGILGVVLVLGLVGGTPTYDLRDVELIREQGDRLRLTGPHGPPQLVPPRAPGPAVIA